MLITKDPGIAQHAEDTGIDVIFIDLEAGADKQARQSGKNAVYNDHSLDHIAPVRSVLKKAELMVRVNALNPDSTSEVERALDAGADCLMLPMFYSAEDVIRFRDMVNGRAKIRPLIETPSAVEEVEKLAKIDDIHSYHFGLNDLHIAWKCHFVFEPLINGKLDAAIAHFYEAGIDYGIGGMAQIGEGDVPGGDVLSEFVGRNSNRVILSRTFHRNSKTLDELHNKMNLKEQVQAIRGHEHRALLRTEEEVQSDHAQFAKNIQSIVSKLSHR